MPLVTIPDDAAWKAISAYERDNEDRGCSDQCYCARGVTATAVLATWRKTTLVGNVRRTCGTPNCTNPRHLRHKSDERVVEVTPDMYHEAKGCLAWDGAFVSGIPMLRIGGKNANVLHLQAAKHLPDYAKVAEKLAGQVVRGWPRKPIVTRFCGRADCVNPEHFVVSPNPVGGWQRFADYMDRESSKGWWFWHDREEDHDDVTLDSVQRWRVFCGLEKWDR
jgi:hypothetical protein